MHICLITKWVDSISYFAKIFDHCCVAQWNKLRLNPKYIQIPLMFWCFVFLISIVGIIVTLDHKLQQQSYDWKKPRMTGFHLYRFVNSKILCLLLLYFVQGIPYGFQVKITFTFISVGILHAHIVYLPFKPAVDDIDWSNSRRVDCDV